MAFVRVPTLGGWDVPTAQSRNSYEDGGLWLDLKRTGRHTVAAAVPPPLVLTRPSDLTIGGSYGTPRTPGTRHQGRPPPGRDHVRGPGPSAAQRQSFCRQEGQAGGRGARPDRGVDRICRRWRPGGPGSRAGGRPYGERGSAGALARPADGPGLPRGARGIGRRPGALEQGPRFREVGAVRRRQWRR